MANIKEIARRAGVSIGTVSNVINGTAGVRDKRRELVLQAIKELDYHPNQIARSLKMSRTGMVGMVISDITNPFFPQVVRGAEDALFKHNHLLITFNTDDQVEREKQVLAVLRARRVDGMLVVVAPAAGPSAHLQDVIKSGLPVVFLDRVPPDIAVDSISVDNIGGSRQCVQHLIELGHRRIGILTGPPALQTARERLQGYHEALNQAGIPADSSLILEGDFRAESGYLLGIKLLAGDTPPTALFISNNTMALGVMKALDELQIHCPQSIALAMFDDLPLVEAFHPHLTAVSQPAYQLGYQGANLLHQKILNRLAPGGPVQILLPTELKIRESSLGYKFTPN
jgi:LacI family transcriptional regulator